MPYTSKINLNRGFMKLDVWKDSVELFKMAHDQLIAKTTMDFKLRSQVLSSTQSISANIAEGYCRRTINEYLQFLNISLGSSGEALTRVICLSEIGVISKSQFDLFDELHYSVENQLLGLIRSLQKRRKRGDWNEELPEPYKNLK